LADCAPDRRFARSDGGHGREHEKVGYSIFVFDLSDEEINHALYGPPAELTREVCVAGY
jgi:hypothetical protein